MKRLMHLLGIPATLPNGLALRGSTTLSRSAGTDGRHSKRSANKLRTATCDRDDATELRIADRSYAGIIADYSRAIDRPNAATTRPNPESGVRPRGFFAKTPFRRLARVASLANIGNVGKTTGESMLCTKSCSRSPSVPVRTNEKIDKSDDSRNQDGISVGKPNEWVNRAVASPNAKETTKCNDSHSRHRDRNENLARSLIQRPKESRATRSSEFTKNNINEKHGSGTHGMGFSGQKKIPDTGPKFGSSGNTTRKSLSDASLTRDWMKKGLTDCSSNASIVSDKPSSVAGNLSPKSFANPVERYCSSGKKVLGTAKADVAVASDKPSVVGDLNPKNIGGNSVERYCSSGKTFVGSAENGANKVSVVVQHLGRTEESATTATASTTWKNVDSNAMFVTVTEQSQLMSTASKSAHLRHVDVRINGKPATEADAVVSKLDKLDVVSPAEKVEITIPVTPKVGAAIGDNTSAPNSKIKLSISRQERASENSSGVEYLGRGTRQVDDTPLGVSRSISVKSASTLKTSKMKNRKMLKDPKLSDTSKVVPWWTTEESFRRSEFVAARSVKSAAIARSNETKMTRLGKSCARGNQEAKRDKRKDETVDAAAKTLKKMTVVSKPSDLKILQNGKKRSPFLSKILANEAQNNKSQGDVKERPKILEGSVGGSKRLARPHQAKVASDKNFQAKNVALPIEKNRAKPIADVSSGKASGGGKTTSVEQVSKSGATDPKAKPESTSDPRQEVASKSVTNATPQLPRTHGTIRLLPQSQLSSGPASDDDDLRRVSVKPDDGTTMRSSGDKISELRQPTTITMRPIEKKKDGTLIDYGLTVKTRKKPGRKLSGSESAAESRAKNITRQKESAVTASVEEVASSGNEDNLGIAINPRVQTRFNGLDKNKPRPNETRAVCRSKSKRSTAAVTKAKTNEPNESADSTTSVKSEGKNSGDPGESQVAGTRSADKKLVYSVWLRQFREQKDDDDTDPTKDPSSRNS